MSTKKPWKGQRDGYLRPKQLGAQCEHCGCLLPSPARIMRGLKSVHDDDCPDNPDQLHLEGL
jgi:hypothetical protein